MRFAFSVERVRPMSSILGLGLIRSLTNGRSRNVSAAEGAVLQRVVRRVRRR